MYYSPNKLENKCKKKKMITCIFKFCGLICFYSQSGQTAHSFIWTLLLHQLRSQPGGVGAHVHSQRVPHLAPRDPLHQVNARKWPSVVHVDGIPLVAVAGQLSASPPPAGPSWAWPCTTRPPRRSPSPASCWPAWGPTWRCSSPSRTTSPLTSPGCSTTCCCSRRSTWTATGSPPSPACTQTGAFRYTHTQNIQYFHNRTPAEPSVVAGGTSSVLQRKVIPVLMLLSLLRETRFLSHLTKG